MASATIKIFLPHGDPKRLRTAELSNWTGKAVAGPRIEFDSILARDEYLSFTKDVEFSSPSAAAAVIHGGQANGLTAWKNKANKSLKELESE